MRRKMQVIAADPRHRTVAVLLEGETKRRRFPRWTMGFEPLDDELAKSIPGFEKTFRAPTGATDEECAVWDLIEWFQRRVETN